MGSYAEAMQQMHVRVTSPDGQIFGIMDGPVGGEISFSEGTYRHYTERSLERQLAALAKLLMVARRRAQREALEAATGMIASDEDPRKVDDPRRRRYLERWAELTSEGMSPGECVFLSATGMRDFNVVIKDGTLQRLEEQDLVEELRGANAALLQDQRRNAQALHKEIYDIKSKTR